MATKRQGTDVDPIERFGPGADEETAGGVAVVRTDSGRALMVPASVGRLRGEAAEVVVQLQDQAAIVHEAQVRLDGLVDEARALGVSWSAIGFSVGLTQQGARQRWGLD